MKRAHNFINLVGSRFGRLLVIARLPNAGNRKARFLCTCACGNKKEANSQELRNGECTSCGCFRKEVAKNLTKTHGMSKTAIYKTWKQMKRRCENTRSKDYRHYGGRGIKVCNRWHHFPNFLKDMGFPPSPKHSINRKNNNGNYDPSNCNWATLLEQRNNTRRNRYITFNGETKTLAQWARHFGVKYSVLLARLDKLHWPVEKAFSFPFATF